MDRLSYSKDDPFPKDASDLGGGLPVICPAENLWPAQPVRFLPVTELLRPAKQPRDPRFFTQPLFHSWHGISFFHLVVVTYLSMNLKYVSCGHVLLDFELSYSLTIHNGAARMISLLVLSHVLWVFAFLVKSLFRFPFQRMVLLDVGFLVERLMSGFFFFQPFEYIIPLAFWCPLFLMRTWLLILLLSHYMWWIIFLSLLSGFFSFVYPTQVSLSFWICKLMFFIKFGKFLAIISWNIFFLLFPVSSSVTCITLRSEWWLRSPEGSFDCSSVFPPFFRLNNFY